MHADEAKQLLGLPPNSRPNATQASISISQNHSFLYSVKAAYKRKVWDYHPDRFPSPEKQLAESQFKLITEAYSSLLAGGGRHSSSSVSYTRVVRYGAPNVHGGRGNRTLIGIPFLLIVFGAIGLGGLNAARAYKREQDANPSTNNPFLP